MYLPLTNVHHFYSAADIAIMVPAAYKLKTVSQNLTTVKLDYNYPVTTVKTFMQGKHLKCFNQQCIYHRHVHFSTMHC